VQLDERLKQDTIYIKTLGLSELLLMNNACYPWLILVPKIKNAVEIIDLSKEHRDILMDEITYCSQMLQKLHVPYKINIATLGNVVRQMHIHIIARNQDDATWPEPVWGKDKPRKLYDNEQSASLIELYNNYSCFTPRSLTQTSN
jgi:diadenosine tetraphosphate (Ap4A) HIT family hydrolase